MPTILGNIELYTGPQELGGADSLIDPIVDFINQAGHRQKLMIAVQEIDNQRIAEAIIEARIRGATIDLVIEQSYLLNTRRPKLLEEVWEAVGEREINRTLFAAILRSTTDVKVDFNPAIFHQKFMVLGNSVLTGSTNFTDTGVTRNLNHVLIVHDASVANAFKREFAEIRLGRFGKESIGHKEKPREVTVSGIRVKPLFAPDHGPEMEIMKQILKAKDRIDFACFTFAQSSGIDDALIAAHDRGVKVRGVLDKRQANQKWAAKSTLQDAGIDLKIAGNSGPLGKVHHKMMAIDDQLSIYGSFNYTGPANLLNDENIVIVGDLEETATAAKKKQGKIAVAAREEIDRIITAFGE
ncbi:phospholipase D-like domain-containing protein [Parasphingopyxis marina]|uniref:Phospholipase D n=1 Tax=Parasphingopyxis marina TaxID=2761622 RepID=A0A842HRE6_9SPHN|nr:phospholipase D-like domain-containing protein [Parasphingopyxis marina]MBC2776368.1 phospholipase [Parasphingopyxis marina]